MPNEGIKIKSKITIKSSRNTASGHERLPRGYLAKLCNGTISASLAAMHEQLKQAIPRQSRLGSDESSLKNNGKPRLQSKGLDLVYHCAPIHFVSHCHHPFAVGAGRTDRYGL